MYLVPPHNAPPDQIIFGPTLQLLTNYLLHNTNVAFSQPSTQACTCIYNGGGGGGGGGGAHAQRGLMLNSPLTLSSDAALPDTEGPGGWHLWYSVPGQDHRHWGAGGHQEVSSYYTIIVMNASWTTAWTFILICTLPPNRLVYYLVIVWLKAMMISESHVIYIQCTCMEKCGDYLWQNGTCTYRLGLCSPPFFLHRMKKDFRTWEECTSLREVKVRTELALAPYTYMYMYSSFAPNSFSSLAVRKICSIFLGGEPGDETIQIACTQIGSRFM